MLNVPLSDRMTRVVHVALQLDTGGMEKLLVEFARHADRSRYDLQFVSMSRRGPVADEIEAMGWPVVALEEPTGLRFGLVPRLARLFRKWRADVVHAHNTHPLIYCAPAARLAGVSTVVYTRHGQRSQATRRQNILYRLAAKLTDAVVCVSRDSAARSVREGVPARKVRTVWNGIDTHRFTYSGPVAAAPAVMVGRLSPEKDVATLLRATALAVHSEPSFRLEVAGDGTCLPALRRQAEDLGIARHVTFLGSVSDVPSLLARSSLCVLSSTTEGISLTLLEAMARGLPVVATRVGGNPEVVEEGRTGLLVPPREPAELADAMLRVWRDPAAARAMGLAGRKRVQRWFDVRRMVAEYEALYCGQPAFSVPVADTLPAFAGDGTLSTAAVG